MKQNLYVRKERKWNHKTGKTKHKAEKEQKTKMEQKTRATNKNQ